MSSALQRFVLSGDSHLERASYSSPSVTSSMTSLRRYTVTHARVKWCGPASAPLYLRLYELGRSDLASGDRLERSTRLRNRVRPNTTNRIRFAGSFLCW